ncbi:UNVERIFIED_CONTAM: hypothetical protein FKN15_009047 [Acipenser sinensis]
MMNLESLEEAVSSNNIQNIVEVLQEEWSSKTILNRLDKLANKLESLEEAVSSNNIQNIVEVLQEEWSSKTILNRLDKLANKLESLEEAVSSNNIQNIVEVLQEEWSSKTILNRLDKLANKELCKNDNEGLSEDSDSGTEGANFSAAFECFSKDLQNKFWAMKASGATSRLDGYFLFQGTGVASATYPFPFQVENNHQGMGTVYPSRREGGFSAVGQTYVITPLRRQYIYAYAEPRHSVYARNDTCPKVEINTIS